MPPHLLSELSIPGSELVLPREPNFDFYNLGRITSVVLDFHEVQRPSLRLIGEYKAQARYRIVIIIEGIRQLTLPRIDHSDLWLPELEVENVTHRGMEGINFEVVSQFERSFHCFCRSIAIESFEPVSEGAGQT